MATKRWNQPRWKDFQGWSLMAKIIAETYTSPKQTNSRMNNAWSILSSTTSFHLSTSSPVSKTHTLHCKIFQMLQISMAGPAPFCCKQTAGFTQSEREKDAALISLKFTFKRWKQCFPSRHFIWHMLAWVVSDPPFRKADIYQKSSTNFARVTCCWLTNPASHPQATEILLAGSPLFEHLPKPLTIKRRFFLIN